MKYDTQRPMDLTLYAIGGHCVGHFLTVVVSLFVQQPVSLYLWMLFSGMGVLGGLEYGFRYGKL